MEEDGTPNKRGEAYCACRYLNCGRKFKSLKALEEHLMALHNISWEAYTRYSPSRHHETIEETTVDFLGKRKDAYCMCTYMECGRKFKMLKNLEEHVTLYHNISWQLYTQYYHRSVRKSPDEKSKSPKAEKKLSSFKTSESPSPSSSTQRNASNGSASTPVSAATGMTPPANPMVSFLPQTTPPYGSYPYLTAQVPLVPAIIQYQPMLTAPVIGYASPPAMPLSQGYLGQSALSMSPLPESVSWYSGQPTSQMPFQQAESGILNLSCPKPKKTKSSPPPARLLDLSKTAQSSRFSTGASQAKNYSNPPPNAKYLNSQSKPYVENVYKTELVLPKTSGIDRVTTKDERLSEVRKKYEDVGKLSSTNLPDTQNGVIVIQPDERFEDTKYGQSLGNREAVGYATAYYDALYKHTRDMNPTSAMQYLPNVPACEISHTNPVNSYSVHPTFYPHEEKVEDLSKCAPRHVYHEKHDVDVTVKVGHSSGDATFNDHSSGGSRAEKTEHSNHLVRHYLEKKTGETYQKPAFAKDKNTSSQESSSTRKDCKYMNEEVYSGSCQNDSPSQNYKHVNEDSQKVPSALKAFDKLTKTENTFTSRKKLSLPGPKKMKRSSSLPNLKTFTEDGDDSDDRLVIDMSYDKKTHESETISGTGVPDATPICNSKEKAKQPSSSIHLKEKSRSKRNRKAKDGKKTVPVNNPVRKLTPAVSRSKSIKRKYRLHLQKTLHSGANMCSRKGSHCTSSLCKLILNLKSVKTKSCKASARNCDTPKFSDSNTTANKKKCITNCKRKKRTLLAKRKLIRPDKSTFEKDKDSPASDTISGSLSITNIPSKDLPALSCKNTEVFPSQGENCTKMTATQNAHLFSRVWPLKILADLSYQAYRRVSRTLDHSQGVRCGEVQCGPNSSQAFVESHSPRETNENSPVSQEKNTAFPHVEQLGKRSICYQWRTLRFVHATAEESEKGFLVCKACGLKFADKAEYVRHRLCEHRSYRCKVCAETRGGPRRSHLYRYLSTLTRHVMLDHGVTAAVDPRVWVTYDSYGGVDLQGVPFIDNLDQLALVTGEKIYTANAVYTYSLRYGEWALRHATSNDRHQMAAPTSADDTCRGGRDAGTEAGTSTGDAGGRPVKILTNYPRVLMTIQEAHFMAATRTSLLTERRSSTPDKALINKQ